nr:hypothetical protein Iba_chr07fCG2040 [Ipomoea batatas]
MTRQVERQSGWRKRNSAPHIGCYLVIPASDAQEPSSAFESPDFGISTIPVAFNGFEDEEKLFPTITFEGTCSAEFAPGAVAAGPRRAGLELANALECGPWYPGETMSELGGLASHKSSGLQ